MEPEAKQVNSRQGRSSICCSVSTAEDLAQAGVGEELRWMSCTGRDARRQV